jgi:hypothetical protein
MHRGFPYRSPSPHSSHLLLTDVCGLEIIMDDEVQWRRRREDNLRLRVCPCMMIYLVDLSNPHGTVTVFLRTMRMSLVMAPPRRRSSTRVRSAAKKSRGMKLKPSRAVGGSAPASKRITSSVGSLSGDDSSDGGAVLLRKTPLDLRRSSDSSSSSSSSGDSSSSECSKGEEID